MPPDEARRKKPAARYQILVVPQGEGGTKRAFTTSMGMVWSGAILLFLLIVGGVLVLLMYTPVGRYIPMRYSEVEERYGSQLLEMQQRLNGLAGDVLALREYNLQLRKALGEFEGRDTTAKRAFASRALRDMRERVTGDSVPPALRDAGAMSEAELFGDYDLMPSTAGLPVAAAGRSHRVLPLLLPTDGFVTQGFDPLRGHFGIDYAVKRGTAVLAGSSGSVVFAGWTFEDGNMIILSHEGGYLTVYKHNEMLLTTVQSSVKRGEVIALSGSTGKTSSGPHLHFEVWKEGVPRDPQEFLLGVHKSWNLVGGYGG